VSAFLHFVGESPKAEVSSVRCLGSGLILVTGIFITLGIVPRRDGFFGAELVMRLRFFVFGE